MFTTATEISSVLLTFRAKKEYNYEYGEGRIVRATEADITLSGEIVTSKVIVSTIKYKYDSDGNLISKNSEDKTGTVTSYSYEINETEDEVVRFKIGSSTVTSHSKTDKFLSSRSLYMLIV